MVNEEKANLSDEQRPTEGLERRSFIERLFKIVTGLWGATSIAVVVSYIKAPGEVKAFEEKVKRIGPLSELEVGSAKFVAHKWEPFWVIRTGEDQLVALPATCTHLRCVLQWDRASGRLVCPCHAGAFDLNGNVVAGPPPRPLKPLRVDVKGGNIYVNLT